VTEQRVESPPTLIAAPARTETRRLSQRARLLRRVSARERTLQLALLVVVLGLWEWFGSRASNFSFAPPTRIVAAAGDMIESGELQSALADSLLALMLGFVFAAAGGVAVGYAMGWWRTLGRTLDPFVAALYVVPMAALIPAMIVWFGLGLASRVIVVFLFCVFEILLSAYAGVKNVDPYVLDVARTFGVTRADLLRKVVFPATLPFMFVGLRMGASRALKGMIVAEMLFAVTGLGRLIIINAQTFRMDRVLVAAITVALIGVLLTAVLQGIERRVMRWRE